MATRNSRVLASFVQYCQDHPDQRFWQALTNWSGWGYVLLTNERVFGNKAGDLHRAVIEYKDPYHWEGFSHLDHADTTDGPVPHPYGLRADGRPNEGLPPPRPGSLHP